MIIGCGLLVVVGYLAFWYVMCQALSRQHDAMDNEEMG
jgi:hypothetical protein